MINTIKEEIDLLYGPPLSIISDCLRGFICAAPGYKFIAGDFSAIEARVIAWLAGQESVLKVFKTHGKIYEFNACRIYNKNNIKDITPEERSIGKVATLALGFQGGVAAFQHMAKAYNVTITDQTANSVKELWRRSNPEIVNFWYNLEDASINAVKAPGMIYKAGSLNNPTKFLCKGSFLFCILPSKRYIVYPYPKIQHITTPWGAEKEALSYMGVDPKTYKWVRRNAYGGLLAENITQAVARDLLAAAMIRFEKNNYKVVMHIHDEIVSEVKENFGSIEEAKKLLCITPEWADGLPIDADCWEGRRFRK